MNKGIKIFNICLALILLFSLGFMMGKKYDVIIDSENHVSVIKQDVNEQKIKQLFNILDDEYIANLNTDSIVDETLNHVLQGLDPHSTYLNPIAGKKYSTSGIFKGLGVEFQVHKDTLFIVRIIPESPNIKKLLPGDKLISIDNKKITGKNINLLTSYIQQQKEHSVELIRNQQKKKISILAKSIKLSNLSSNYMLTKKSAYLKLAHFNSGAAAEVHHALEKFKAFGAENIILDLRDNGGGLLDEAIEIADEFLENKKTIVSLKNNKDQSEKQYYATQKGTYKNGNVFVLINENSASASEVLAGALQDNDVGAIIGRRSFGKGLVQREITLNDGSKFRITTAKYLTPSGRSIQKNYTDGAGYSHELINRYRTGELYDENKIFKVDSLKKITPKGKVIYGGGGIIPDEFIPIKYINFGESFYNNNGDEVLNTFIVTDIHQNIPKYYSYTEKMFLESFNINPIFTALINHFKENAIAISEHHKNLLKIYVKAFIAKILFGENTYYKIWNESDDMLKKVIELENQNP